MEIVDLDSVEPEKRSRRGKSKLKKKYLRKFPPIRQDAEGNVTVDGVSNKAMSCPIPWKLPRNEVVRTERHEDGSGDMGGLMDLLKGGPPDMALPRVEANHPHLLASAPAVVRKSLSLEFARNRDITEYVKVHLANRVKEHRLDAESLCAGIASLTVGIRNDQEQLGELRSRPIPKKNMARQASMKRRIDRRQFLLQQLRQRDYRKFEWLVEELDLVYKPFPMQEEEVQRRYHQTRLTALWCDEHRLHKLREYKRSLEEVQPSFLREKAEKLRWIAKEEEELGLERTVEEEEVEKLLKQAEEIELRLENEEKQEVEYLIYEPEDPNQSKNVFTPQR